MKELKKELEKELKKLNEQLEKAIKLDMHHTTIFKIDGKIEAIKFALNKINDMENK